MALAWLCQSAPDALHGQSRAPLARQQAAFIMGQLAWADSLEARKRGACHQACCKSSPLPPGGWHASLNGLAPEARCQPRGPALPRLPHPRCQKAAHAGGVVQPICAHGHGQQAGALSCQKGKGQGASCEVGNKQSVFMDTGRQVPSDVGKGISEVPYAKLTAYRLCSLRS
ncbi:hypothetical protein DUNSADRAFT_17612 [Dunaliella salina]|uniref:Uncharacterized protein n=1 Tax=Dunaliella salina TaxID=3046 RepID=A0ABQ7G1E8_DUNSA|nr:hypothetical protein DUNSADRAFT_17612 [Dunaliella salina]|eukprot:KAF5828433.1 hypothetical protein DUNSADRAFT_17612 [Dunaliella salina]